MKATLFFMIYRYSIIIKMQNSIDILKEMSILFLYLKSPNVILWIAQKIKSIKLFKLKLKKVICLSLMKLYFKK